MYGPKYVFIMPAWFETNWWDIMDDDALHNCTSEQMDAVARGSISIYYAILLQNSASSTASISGMSAEDYIREFRIRTGNTTNVQSLFGFGEAAYGYDSIWTAAVVLDEAVKRLKAMNPSRSILDFRYEDNEMGDMLYDIMANTSFPGLTGPVLFSDSGDRKGLIRIMQTQNNTDVRIAVYNVAAEPGKELKFENDTPVFWKGGKVPVDSVMEKREIQIIHPAVFILMVVFSVFGIWLAIFFLIFNIMYRNRRIIKMSSPRLNNIILVGGLITYLSVIFLGIDVGLVPRDILPLACRAYTWCFYVSFCMTFGAMFSKTWRVHRIFTTKTVMPRRIRDPQLFAWVGALVLFVALILAAWEVFDPIVLETEEGSETADPLNDDIILIPVFVICTSNWEPYWIGALYVIEGLLLVFGAFLSWETRKVHMPVLNDSKQIGTSIYIVVTTNFAAVPVSIAVQNPSARYALLATLIITSITVPLCLVFLPKVKMRNDVYPRGITTNQSTHHTTHNNCSSPTPTPIASQDHVRLRTDDNSGASQSSKQTTEDKGINTLLSFGLGDNRTIIRHRRRRKFQNKESPW
ncbi:gamma-aminobutyric acid type B receptor subunit 2-like [Amphiura filiformis]|uniref:gamma-aminobutyric acid type B receptor subunit 2-like n=1 Tax=Amphiura filiformis TaxID=82378 RepID=UPI003B22568D